MTARGTRLPFNPAQLPAAQMQSDLKVSFPFQVSCCFQGVFLILHFWAMGLSALAWKMSKSPSRALCRLAAPQ